jgi:hypothetical protein
MAILLNHNFQAHVLRHMGGVVVQHFASTSSKNGISPNTLQQVSKFDLGQ